MESKHCIPSLVRTIFWSNIKYTISTVAIDSKTDMLMISNNSNTHV